DDHLAGRKAEIHLPDQLQYVRKLIEKPDVDESVFRPAVNQVNVDTHPPLRLVVHLDDAREDVTPLDHSKANSRSAFRPKAALFYSRSESSPPAEIPQLPDTSDLELRASRPQAALCIHDM